eukprot:jgi/Tetstr1/443448/TSEL_031459.t1
MEADRYGLGPEIRSHRLAASLSLTHSLKVCHLWTLFRSDSNGTRTRIFARISHKGAVGCVKRTSPSRISTWVRGANARRPAQRGANARRPGQRGANARRPGQRGANARRPAQRGASARRPAQRGANARRPAQRGANAQRPAQRGANARRPAQRILGHIFTWRCRISASPTRISAYGALISGREARTAACADISPQRRVVVNRVQR